MTPRSMKIPSKAATANIVQAYICQVLIDDYDLPPEEARQVSSKWQYARGEELLGFSEATYVGIFGHEVGAILYRNVQARSRRKALEQAIPDRSKKSISIGEYATVKT